MAKVMALASFGISEPSVSATFTDPWVMPCVPFNCRVAVSTFAPVRPLASWVSAAGVQSHPTVAVAGQVMVPWFAVALVPTLGPSGQICESMRA